MDSFHTRWNIVVSAEEGFNLLKNRLQVLFQDAEVPNDEIDAVVFALGIVKAHAVSYDAYGDIILTSEFLISNAKTAPELAKVVEVLISCVSDFKKQAARAVALINSANCGIVMKQGSEGWLTYPAGERMFDEELVNRPLSFLTGTALNEYTKALEHYAQNKWEESAEKTRRALEEYLREKTTTNKGLEQLIGHVATTLKASKKIPDHLRNTINNILRTLDTNYNESSKHNSKTFGQIESEFLIYQTGLVMRLLNQIDF